MSPGVLPVERLRQYLRQLPPGARALLIAELERAVERGDNIPGGELLLQEVRGAVQDAATPPAYYCGIRARPTVLAIPSRLRTITTSLQYWRV